MASPDEEPVGAAPSKRRRLSPRQSSRNGQDVLLTAAKSGWGTTLRYCLLLLVHRGGPLSLVGLVGYQIARSKGWI